MSDKANHSKHPQSRTDTLIGVGTRFEGNITFTGVLRIEGELVGDVACERDHHGLVVVGKSGSVTGAVLAPHVVVAGCVTGSVTSSGSLEILERARVKGDASYCDMVIHEGGVIEGMLTPMASAGSAARIQNVEPVAQTETPEPSSENIIEEIALAKRRPPQLRRLGLAAVGLGGLGLAVAVWMNSNTTEPARTVAAAQPKAELPRWEPSAPATLASPASAASAVPEEMPKTVVASAPAPAVSDPPVAVKAVPAPAPAPTPAAAPDPEPKNVTAVKGDDATKPAEFVYVMVGKEAAVLYKKQRNGPAEGTRIDLAQGANKRIALAKDDLLRVEQGQGVQMFYQGRKLSTSTITGGTWLHFVSAN